MSRIEWVRGYERLAWSKVYFATLLLQLYETFVTQKFQGIIPDVQICYNEMKKTVVLLQFIGSVEQNKTVLPLTKCI